MQPEELLIVALRTTELLVRVVRLWREKFLCRTELLVHVARLWREKCLRRMDSLIHAVLLWREKLLHLLLQKVETLRPSTLIIPLLQTRHVWFLLQSWLQDVWKTSSSLIGLRTL